MIAVKICGVTRREDALLAAELGASAVGFVFWPGSPRCLDPARARAIVDALPPFVTSVGVFVDQPVEYVTSVTRLARLGVVQLHGHESAEYCARIETRAIKAVPVGSSFDPASVAAIPPHVGVLLDVQDSVRHGGTGRTIDWAAAARVARTRPIILSGGLRAENVAAAIAEVQPCGLDVSSGVESGPGIKDPARLRDFFRAVRAAGEGVQ